MPSHYINKCWQISLRFKSKSNNLHSRKWIWKYLQDGGHFFLGLSVLTIYLLGCLVELQLCISIFHHSPYIEMTRIVEALFRERQCSYIVNSMHVSHQQPWYILTMMTSSNGNIFRVTGPLCGEFTGDRWIPRKKASNAELWFFLWTNGWVNNRDAGDLGRHRIHYDVIVMIMQDNRVGHRCGWNYLSIPKLQQLHCWNLGMDK